MSRLLRVVAPHFVAGAVWEKDQYGDWVCTAAAPILAWMKTKSALYVGRYLQQKMWSYEWLETPGVSGLTELSSNSSTPSGPTPTTTPTA